MTGTESYAAVIGGVNIDIGGKSFGPLIEKDSNPGRIRTSLGGVGRNIAHNMSLLGMNVVFLTAFGDDLYKDRIEAACAEQGIDIRYARKVSGVATSMYVYLGGPDGEMALAVSDMEICDSITPEYVAGRQPVIDGACLAVIDANLPEETIRYILTHTKIPVFADTVSAAKAVKIRPYLDRVHTLKPNRLEAQVLSGIEITDERSAHEALEILLDKGVQRVFLTLGRDGVLAAQKTKAPYGTAEKVCIYRQPCLPAQIRSTTGAGDAFMAGLAWSYAQGLDMERTLKAASAAAAITSEGEQTIHPGLSAETVKERAGISYR